MFWVIFLFSLKNVVPALTEAEKFGGVAKKRNDIMIITVRSYRKIQKTFKKRSYFKSFCFVFFCCLILIFYISIISRIVIHFACLLMYFSSYIVVCIPVDNLASLFPIGSIVWSCITLCESRKFVILNLWRCTLIRFLFLLIFLNLTFTCFDTGPFCYKNLTNKKI